MKVLLINGSPHAKGSTYTALNEVAVTLEKEGIETEMIHIGNQAIRGCIACAKCREIGHCVFDDAVNEVAEKFAHADGLVVGSPVYYASANATLVLVISGLIPANFMHLAVITAISSLVIISLGLNIEAVFPFTIPLFAAIITKS